MSHQTRPPAPVVEAILSDVLTHATPSQKVLDSAIRKHLQGTNYQFPTIAEMVKVYRKMTVAGGRNQVLERLLRCKTVRTDSGVAPITLLTKPYACPGKCVYCPTEVRMPKSYVASEPAAARALQLKFDPYVQVVERVKALERNGHEAKKMELIIKGGTWSAYPWDYRKWFIKRCYDAANHLGQREKKTRYGSLASSQIANEGSEYRVIGLTIETRPDWITPKEIVRLRELGVTRVELGVQALDDQILELTKRGHTVDDTVRATVLLKAAAFKTDYHILPGQPGATPERDIEMFDQLFTDDRFCPDMIKLYPCVVLPSAELAEWHKEGRYAPLEGETLIEMMVRMQSVIPRYCRVSRLIRDFPSFEISAGNKVTNLRDVIEVRMKERGIECKCLRCREAGHRPPLTSDTKLGIFRDVYRNAYGTEYFLSVEDEKRTTVVSFLRLRLPDQHPVMENPKTRKMFEEVRACFPELEGCAFIRELHTYGQALKLSEDRTGAVQHQGWGKVLMAEAEKIAGEHGFGGLAVISGVGVKQYYQQRGFSHAGTYMKKLLQK
jgi:elongator complex protein 3